MFSIATRQCVTGLIVNERVEYTKGRGVVVREYTERLLHEAIQNGDRHLPTMELANWWLTDKSAVHKLFKVLAPRLRDLPGAYTRILRAPILYKPEGGSLGFSVVGLRSEHQGELGIYVQEIQPEGIAGDRLID